LRLLAAASALSISSVHVAILNQHLEEKTYVGALFLAATLALQLVALELAQSRRDPLLDAAAWAGGTAVVAAMFALFVVSRTAGLPGYHEPWDEIGIASLALEGLFLTTAVANVLLGRRRRSSQSLRVLAVHRDAAA
jgi:peptidoglycan/LPS O-acetylase OafA/YrhL